MPRIQCLAFEQIGNEALHFGHVVQNALPGPDVIDELERYFDSRQRRTQL